MDALPAFGKDIGQSVLRTFQTYFPLLAARSTDFAQPEEFSYGSDARQKVDIYTPGDEGTYPVMVFVHGGGLDKGDKRMPPARGGHCQNIGDFFSRRGFITAIPNYRLRIPDSSSPLYSTSSNASFPSGGEDIATLLAFLADSPAFGAAKVDPSNVFLMGNSAGAVHLTTYLYRDGISLPSLPSILSAPAPIRPRGALLISFPSEFGNANAARAQTLYGYFGALDLSGDEQKKLVAERDPIALRRNSKDRTATLVARNELDPEDEILEPMAHFDQVFEEVTGSKPYNLHIEGHNHISTPLGLGLGGREEKWGEDVIVWCKQQMEA